MSFEKNDPHIVLLKVEKAIQPLSGRVFCWTDMWWIYDQESDSIVFWNRFSKKDLQRAAPQCNANESLAETIRAKLYPWATLKFLPAVFIETQ